MATRNRKHTDHLTYHYTVALPGESDTLTLRAGVNVVDGVEHYIDPVWIDVVDDLSHHQALGTRYYEEHKAFMGDGIGIESFGSNRFSPETLLIDPKTNTSDVLEQVISRLSTVERELLYDRYGAMTKQVDIARKLGITEGAVRKRLKKLHMKVRKELENLIT